MMYTNHISIYEYDDYLEVLRDLIEVRKSQGLPFSFRWFSQKAGFSSPNYLHLVLSKKRHLSSEAIEKVIQIFHMNAKEAEYFRLLVNFKKSKTNSEKSEIGEKILTLRSKSKTQYLNQSQMSYYLSWRNIAIRECLLLNYSGLLPEQICQLVHPHPHLKEVLESLENLQTLHLVSKKDSGLWAANPGSISTGDKVDSSSLIKYHLEMIDLAKESLDRFSAAQRDVTNVSVPVSKENFEKIRSMVQILRKEILRISEEDSNPELVAQINFQLFPIATKGTLE